MPIRLSFADASGRETERTFDGDVRIGRDPAQVDLVLESEYVSRYHCSLHRRRVGDWVLIHRGRNSSRLEDRTLRDPGQQAVLTSGGTLTVGKVRIHIEIDEIPDELADDSLIEFAVCSQECVIVDDSDEQDDEDATLVDVEVPEDVPPLSEVGLDDEPTAPQGPPGLRLGSSPLMQGGRSDPRRTRLEAFSHLNPTPPPVPGAGDDGFRRKSPTPTSQPVYVAPPAPTPPPSASPYQQGGPLAVTRLMDPVETQGEFERRAVSVHPTDPPPSPPRLPAPEIPGRDQQGRWSGPLKEFLERLTRR